MSRRGRIRLLVGLLVLGAAAAGALLIAVPKKVSSAAVLAVEWLDRGSTCAAEGTSSSAPAQRIAHAGGSWQGLEYTSSRQALDQSRALGCAMVEVDLEWTSDERLVLLHDWHRAGELLADQAGGRQRSYSEFTEGPTRTDVDLLGEDDLVVWMMENAGTRVILDAKRSEIAAFKRLLERTPEAARSRLVAQAYTFEQVAALRELGFTQVYFTAYKSMPAKREIVSFVASSPGAVSGIVIPVDLAVLPYGREVAALGIPTFAHPVNSPRLERYLAGRSIGVFTSQLCGCP